MKKNRSQKGLSFLLSALISLVIIVGWQYYSTAQKTPLTLETALLTLEQLGDGIYTLVSDTDYPP